jgi:hypothetical protein
LACDGDDNFGVDEEGRGGRGSPFLDDERHRLRFNDLFLFLAAARRDNDNEENKNDNLDVMMMLITN